MHIALDKHDPHTLYTLMCRSLQVLALGNNKLSAFPECILALPNLTHLYLNNNAITDIPSGISSLTNLQVCLHQAHQISHWQMLYQQRVLCLMHLHAPGVRPILASSFDGLA